IRDDLVTGVQTCALPIFSRSELGRVSLNSRVTAVWNDPRDGMRRQTSVDQALETGRSPSVADPGNASANAALKSQPPFNRAVARSEERRVGREWGWGGGG